jgi:hypothetical protein
MEVGPTGAQFGYSDPDDSRYCAAWDGRQIVRKAVSANAEYLVLWVRDGDYAYYDSKLLPKAPGLRERDPLRDAVDEAGKHDLPVISYCVVQQGGHFLKAHPEWEMREPGGEPIGHFWSRDPRASTRRPRPRPMAVSFVRFGRRGKRRARWGPNGR